MSSCIGNTDSVDLHIAAGVLTADVNVDADSIPVNPLEIVAGKGLLVLGADGWLALPATLAYLSADSTGHGFTCTTSADLTSFITPGDRIKLTNGGTVKYFLVVAISATQIMLYGGTTYTVANSAITLPYFSKQKSPVGFPLDPASWTETVSDTSDRSQASAVQNTWYNIGSLLITLPVGAWRLAWVAALATNVALRDMYTTLSTANNSESDADFTGVRGISGSSSTDPQTMGVTKNISVAAVTPYYLNSRTIATGTPTLNLLGATGSKTRLTAVSNYL